MYTGISDAWDELTYTCYLERDSLAHYNSNGICIYPNKRIDIVSRYKEPIDEDKLDKLATSVLCDINPTKALNKIEAFDWGFKAGYRKAIEE